MGTRCLQGPFRPRWVPSSPVQAARCPGGAEMGRAVAQSREGALPRHSSQPGNSRQGPGGQLPTDKPTPPQSPSPTALGSRAWTQHPQGQQVTCLLCPVAEVYKSSG